MLLCQGLLTGLSCGMSFGPIPSNLSHWFNSEDCLRLVSVPLDRRWAEQSSQSPSAISMNSLGTREDRCDRTQPVVDKIVSGSMDHVGHHPDHDCHAHGCKSSKNFCVNLVGTVSSRIFFLQTLKRRIDPRK